MYYTKNYACLERIINVIIPSKTVLVNSYPPFSSPEPLGSSETEHEGFGPRAQSPTVKRAKRLWGRECATLSKAFSRLVIR